MRKKASPLPVIHNLSKSSYQNVIARSSNDAAISHFKIEIATPVTPRNNRCEGLLPSFYHPSNKDYFVAVARSEKKAGAFFSLAR